MFLNLGGIPVLSGQKGVPGEKRQAVCNVKPGTSLRRNKMRLYSDTVPDRVNDVYHAIRDEFSSSDPQINRILDQALSIRGKGVRPRFMRQVVRLNGGAWDAVSRAAMVIEAIHLASLLHDDVVDGSQLRRGSATLNSRYSDKVSVLFGDYIFMRALAIADTLGNADVVAVIHDAVGRMVEGEIRESICPGIVDEDTYLSIISNKTAALFAAAGEIGIILSGGERREQVLARELGECIGMAFQIIDDTLDFSGDTEVMGKHRFMDIGSGCVTLPLIYSLRGYDSEEVERMVSGAGDSAEHLLSLVEANGGIEYARERASGYLTKCREIVRCFPNGDSGADWDVFFSVLIDRKS